MPPQCYLINLPQTQQFTMATIWSSCLGSQADGYCLILNRRSWQLWVRLCSEMGAPARDGFRLAPQFILSLSWRRRRSSYLGCVLFKEDHNCQEDQPNIQFLWCLQTLFKASYVTKSRIKAVHSVHPKAMEKGVFIMPLEGNEELWWVFNLWGLSSVLGEVNCVQGKFSYIVLWLFHQKALARPISSLTPPWWWSGAMTNTRA